MLFWATFSAFLDAASMELSVVIGISAVAPPSCFSTSLSGLVDFPSSCLADFSLSCLADFPSSWMVDFLSAVVLSEVCIRSWSSSGMPSGVARRGSIAAANISPPGLEALK